MSVLVAYDRHFALMSKCPEVCSPEELFGEEK